MVVTVMAGVLTIMMLFVARRDGVEGIRLGLKSAWLALRGVVVQMVLGLIMAGMAQVALPEALVSRLMGDESGFTGVLVGALVGMLIPTGPYVVIPLAASLLSTGAGVGPITAFMTAWSVTPLSRTLVWELPLMGAAFTGSRMLASLPFPVFVGLVMPYVYRLFT